MPIVPAPRILVVDDHAALRSQIVSVLESAGWRVEEASDGRLALQMVLEQPPDVLLLDLGLPGLDGLNVCAQLRERADRHVPVLMLTARDTLSDKGRGFAAGADDYLLKPFASEELLWRCQALARRGELGRSPVLQRGALRIDRRSGEVHSGDRLVEVNGTHCGCWLPWQRPGRAPSAAASCCSSCGPTSPLRPMPCAATCTRCARTSARTSTW